MARLTQGMATNREKPVRNLINIERQIRDDDITALLMRFRNEGYTHHTTRDNNETLQIGSQIEPITPAQYLDFG